MTDLIDRVDGAFIDPEVSTKFAPDERAPGVDALRGPSMKPMPILLSVAAGCSAVLLFSMASGHLTGAKATVGIIAAIAEVVWAITAVTKPSRLLFGLVAASNLVIVGFWLVVRGTDRVSLTTTGIGIALAATAVVVGGLLGLRPDTGQHWESSTAVFGSLLPVGLGVIMIVGLFATSTGSSAPAPSSSTPANQPGGASAALALATTVKVPGENSKTFQSVVAGNETEQSELQKWVPLGAHDQAILTQQLSESLQAAERFPTVASAKAAGMILAGGMAPGVGAHYQEIGSELYQGINPDGSVNPLYPASWIYSSTADDAPVVGVMYESLTNNPPAGFIGPNDHWHRHSNICVQFLGGKIGVPFAADQDVTPQECADVHGTFMKKTVWMVHAWVVPGWESPQGVFSHDNLHVYCPGNTDITDAIGFCVRQS